MRVSDQGKKLALFHKAKTSLLEGDFFAQTLPRRVRNGRATITLAAEKMLAHAHDLATHGANESPFRGGEAWTFRVAVCLPPARGSSRQQRI
jgi:hypothetical protein